MYCREDMSRVKRVKFTDPKSDHLPSCRPDAASIQYEATQAPRSDAPKTSEYAFFKKLRKDAGFGHSYPLQKEDNQMKNVELSDCTRGFSNTFKQSRKDLRSSLLVEKARPINQDPFHSPPRGESKNSEISNKDIRSPSLISKITHNNHEFFPSIPGGASKNSGNQYSDKGIFSTKRQKLCQWVADASLPEVDEHGSKGFDLVSVLLSRLFPEGNENNCCRDPKSRLVEIDTKYQLPTFPESDTHAEALNWTHTRKLMESEHGSCWDDGFSKYWSDRPKYQFPTIPESDTRVEGLNWTHTRKLKESEHGSYWDDGFSKYWSDRPKERVLSKWDNVGSESPSISYTTKAHLQYKYRTPGCDLDDIRIASLCTESDSSFCLSFDKYGSITSSHLKDLDGFYDPNVSALGRESRTLLLDWDFNNEKDEQDFPVTSQNTEMNLYSTLATSLGDEHQQSLDNGVDAGALCSSSLFSNHSPKSTSLPHIHLASFRTHDFGRHLEDECRLVAELNQYLFTLSGTQKYLKLVEDCNADNILDGGGSIILSPQDHPWFMNKDFSEKHHPGLESLLPIGLDFDLGWKCLSMIDSFTESHPSSYNAFQFCQKESISSRLLTKEENESCLYRSNPREITTHFSEDALDSHDWSSINFQKSLDKEMGRPLLLDNSSWARSEEEKYYDGDDDNEWKFI